VKSNSSNAEVHGSGSPSPKQQPHRQGSSIAGGSDDRGSDEQASMSAAMMAAGGVQVGGSGPPYSFIGGDSSNRASPFVHSESCGSEKITVRSVSQGATIVTSKGASPYGHSHSCGTEVQLATGPSAGERALHASRSVGGSRPNAEQAAAVGCLRGSNDDDNARTPLHRRATLQLPVQGEAPQASQRIQEQGSSSGSSGGALRHQWTATHSSSQLQQLPPALAPSSSSQLRPSTAPTSQGTLSSSRPSSIPPAASAISTPIPSVPKQGGSSSKFSRTLKGISAKFRAADTKHVMEA